jgi:gliding motility-associated-like protein
MKKVIRFTALIWLMTSFAFTIHGQQFQPQLSIPLPTDASFENIRVADFDNDSLLDILAIGTLPDLKKELIFFRNSGTSFTSALVIPTGMIAEGIEISDINGDNQVDVIMTSGDPALPTTRLYRNTGNFVFAAQQLLTHGGSYLKFGDMNSDGDPELILSRVNGTENVIEIYENISGVWKMVNDSIKVLATGLNIFDADNDGDQDLFVTGTRSSGSRESALYLNHHEYYLKQSAVLPVNGISSVSDLDHTGSLDVFLSGVNNSTAPVSAALLNVDGVLTASNPYPNLVAHDVFTGDLNSDGKCDVSIFGLDASNAKTNVIVFANGETASLRASDINSQTFADTDRDGDLDLIQVTSNTSQELIIYSNETAVNGPPGKPSNPIAMTIFNRVFLMWDDAPDDHTEDSVITYDVNLRKTGGDILSPEFDQINFQRLMVSHGDAGTKNYVLLQAAVPSFDFSIQAVDNAYYATRASMCVGSGASGCSTISFQELEVCRNEAITFSSTDNTYWFSFSQGLIGFGLSPPYTATASDTVFSVQPVDTGNSCPVIKVYTVKVSDVLSHESLETRFVCDDTVLELEAEAGFTVEWSSANLGFISNSRQLDFTASENDTVKLKLTKTGCTVLRETALIISKPEVAVAAEAYQIIKGESVQLNATGNGTFLWSPANGLDSPAIPNPTASPLLTTEYVVTVTDTIGCISTARVLVLVEETAFVPNLFTPNQDGKNDELKVYGLSDATAFNFNIYNREGSLVYSSENVLEVTSTGWDGMAHGVKQPGGVYYWVVRGETSYGTKILLNGKTSGSIVLIR